MTEVLNLFSAEKLKKGIRNTATIFAIGLALTGCSTPEERYQEQVRKVQQLEHKLKQQQKNYYDVSTQRQIQEDLKENGADQTINQEIGYSIDRTKDQDQEISKTKQELADAQKELAKMKEEIDFKAKTVTEHSEKPNPHKYDYIPEEFKRGREAR